MKSRRPPHPPGSRLRAATALPILLALAIASGPVAQAQQATGPEAAIELYEAGRYAEAGELLAALDARGELDGSLLYRLYYCQRYANDPKAAETLQRSIVPLEEESAAGLTLEAPFYLVNAYTNLARPADAARVALAATARVETGAIEEPTSGLEQFRLGKLYVDAGKGALGEKWFATALDSLAAEDGTKHRAYITWAAGFLADASFEREDYMAAADYYGRLAELREPTTDSLDRLAVARARAGLYAEAGKAWRQAELLDPANANRARYCYRLVEAASRMDSVSGVAPDGRLWVQLNKDDLAEIMRKQAVDVRAIQDEATASAPLDAETRARLQARLDVARAFFVPAAIEYALQGNSIREAAFFGGYAPLIFKEKEWRALRR